MPEEIEDHQPLSAVLNEVADYPHPRIGVDHLTALFGDRALGALLLIFALLCLLPLPPGATTIFGRRCCCWPPAHARLTLPWLPVRLRRRDISTRDLSHGLRRAIPWLQRIEAVSRPRFAWLFDSWGQRLIGLVCTLLALVLILPIPLGNMMPAAAVAVLSLSLIQRDGILALIGYGLAVASAGLLALAAGLLIAAVQHFIGMLASA